MEPLLLFSTILLATFLLCFLLLSPFLKPHTEFQKVYTVIPPFLSSLNRFPADFSQDITKYTRRVRFLGTELLVTADPMVIQYTSSTSFHEFNRGHTSQEVMDTLGRSILNAEGSEWAEQRKLLRSWFSMKDFKDKSYQLITEKVANSLVPVLDHFCASTEREADLQDLFTRFAYDITTFFGTCFDPNSLSIPLVEVPVTKAVDELVECLYIRSLTPSVIMRLNRRFGLGVEKRIKKSSELLRDYVSQRVRILIEMVSQGKVEPGSLGPSLASHAKDDIELIEDEMLSLLLAGTGTVSAALTWLIWVISEHPSVEDKIREEIQKVINPDPDSFHLFNAKEISKMVYLQAAICESLRLYPPVPMNSKGPYEAQVLPTGHHVGPKTVITFALSVMGRLEAIWGKDSLEFRPERWITEKGELKHEPAHKFPVFNLGPRICLGKDLALFEVRTVAATLIHNYDLHIPKGQDTRPTRSLIIKMKNGLRATIRKRWA